MEKKVIQAVIKFLHLKGKMATQIKSRLDALLGDSSPSLSTVSFWDSEFKCGRTRTCDKPRSGRPKTATTPEIVDKGHDTVLADRRMKVCET